VTVVVTGGTGFLGSALLELLAERDEVVALHRPGAEPPALADVRWLPQDLAAPLGSGLPEAADAVIHLAQSRLLPRVPRRRARRLCRQCRGDGRAARLRAAEWREGVHYASSGAVYASGPEPVRETDAPQPNNFYAASKRAGELAAEQYRSLLNAHVLRFFFIYGPGQRNMFIPGVLARIADGQEVTLAGADGIRVNPSRRRRGSRRRGRRSRSPSRTDRSTSPAPTSSRSATIAEIGRRLLGTEPALRAGGNAQPDLVASIDRMREPWVRRRWGIEEGLRRTVEAA